MPALMKSGESWKKRDRTNICAKCSTLRKLSKACSFRVLTVSHLGDKVLFSSRYRAYTSHTRVLWPASWEKIRGSFPHMLFLEFLQLKIFSLLRCLMFRWYFLNPVTSTVNLLWPCYFSHPFSCCHQMEGTSVLEWFPLPVPFGEMCSQYPRLKFWVHVPQNHHYTVYKVLGPLWVN